MAKMENTGKHGIGSGSGGEAGLQARCEQIVKSEQLQIDRKTLVLTLKKNQRGDYVRISERAGSHQNTIIFSATGIRGLIKILAGMARNVGPKA